MKKMLIPLLVLAMLCVCLAALAEGDAIRLELDTSNLQVFEPDDPYLNGLTAEGNTLPVIVLTVKRSIIPQVNVLPRSIRNRKVTLSVDNEETVRIRGNVLTGMRPGESVLTVVSQEDPSVTLQYRIVVIQPVTRIVLEAPETTLAAGKTLALTAVCLPENATLKQVVWTSLNEQVATVDRNGVVTAVNRGTALIMAVAGDGSKVRAFMNIRVTRSAEEIRPDLAEVTIDVGRNRMLRVNVLPGDTDNKKVSWSSSDESVATVNAQGRVTAVALGNCEITCTSQDVETVQAKILVHVQQPVWKVMFGEAPSVYNGESAQLTWTVEPADASNPKLKFISSDDRIVTVDENGVITGVAGGDAWVRAVTTDGSNRQARVRVKVCQHLTGVHMRRKTAYIEKHEMAVAGAVLEPEKGRNMNHNMTWECADTSVATVKPVPGQPNKFQIYGVEYGDTTITGITEDGGFQASILVRVGRWENSVKINKVSMDPDGWMYFRVKNVSGLNITGIKLECICFGSHGKPAEGINPDDGSNILRYAYRRALGPGSVTREDEWKLIGGYDRSVAFKSMKVRITEFQIDYDWVKVIREKARKSYLFRK